MPADYLAGGARDIAALKPQVALIQAFAEYPQTLRSPEQSLNAAIAAADNAKRAGCVPILVTGSLDSDIAPEMEAVRQTMNARVRALAAKGYEVLDLDALWRSGENPAGWKPGFATDRWHPSDAATRIAAEALAHILRRILALPD